MYLTRLLLTLLLTLGASSYALGDSAVLTWTNPSANNDGSPLTDLAGVNIYRGPCGPTPLPGPAITTHPSTTPGATGTYTDAAPPAGNQGYEVTATDISGNESPRSNQVCKVMTAQYPFLHVVSISTIPAVPVAGQEIRFTAVITNTGQAAIAPGVSLVTQFVITNANGSTTNCASSGPLTNGLAVGVNLTMSSPPGGCSGATTRPKGTYSVTATGDDSLALSFTVPPVAPTAPSNLAVQ